MVDIGKEWSRKKTKSIKYCAPKYHNVGPLTDMMAVAAAVSQQRKQTAEAVAAALGPADCPMPPRRQLPQQPPPAKCYRTIGNDLVISWLKGFITVLLFNQHINFGAAIPTSPITLKLLLTSMTVVTVASTKEGMEIFELKIDIHARIHSICK